MKNIILHNENLLDKDIYSINDNTLLEELFSIFCKQYILSNKNISLRTRYLLEQKHISKNQLKLKMI